MIHNLGDLVYHKKSKSVGVVIRRFYITSRVNFGMGYEVAFSKKVKGSLKVWVDECPTACLRAYVLPKDRPRHYVEVGLKLVGTLGLAAILSTTVLFVVVPSIGVASVIKGRTSD